MKLFRGARIECERKVNLASPINERVGWERLIWR